MANLQEKFDELSADYTRSCRDIAKVRDKLSRSETKVQDAEERCQELLEKLAEQDTLLNQERARTAELEAALGRRKKNLCTLLDMRKKE